MYESIGISEAPQDDAACAELNHPDVGAGVAPAPVKNVVERYGSRGEVSAPTASRQPAGVAAPPLVRRVLVVDDNVDAAQTVAMLLEVLGHETVVKYDPLQALACARERSFDAFVLDIGLPVMDGHELARQIRALPRAAGALFIALTGYGQNQDREEAQQAGFDHYLVKPADLNEVNEVLARAEARR
jgi:CheY-like chemotaxis protein